MAKEQTIARASGVTSVGSEEWPLATLVLRGLTPGGAASVVVQTPDERYRELFISGTAPGTLQHRAAPGTDEPIRTATIGGNRIPNAALWIRSLTLSRLVIPKDDTGVQTALTVSVAGLTQITANPTGLDVRNENTMVMGHPSSPVTRVWIKCMPGKPSGLVLQDMNRVPWVFWVNASDVLKITTWEDFLIGA